MIETKLFEIRDAGTFIPVAAFRCRSLRDILSGEVPEAEHYLFRRSGFRGEADQVFVCKLATGGGECDPYSWKEGGARTMQVAHQYIEAHWTTLTSGDVVCVETILGERETPKISERLEGGVL